MGVRGDERSGGCIKCFAAVQYDQEFMTKNSRRDH
jgi:hypothetical protein